MGLSVRKKTEERRRREEKRESCLTSNMLTPPLTAASREPFSFMVRGLVLWVESLRIRWMTVFSCSTLSITISIPFCTGFSVVWGQIQREVLIQLLHFFPFHCYIICSSIMPAIRLRNARSRYSGVPPPPPSGSQVVAILYSAYISRVFNFANFANLESFVKFIQRKFEPLRCNTHGQHEFAKFIQRIPSKQLFAKI